MSDPIRHPATPTEAFRMGTLVQQQNAIQAQMNALTSAAATRLKLQGNGQMGFDVETAEWVAATQTETPNAS